MGLNRRSGAGAAPTIALAVIAPAMGTHLDLEDVAVTGAGNLFKGRAAIGTALLLVRQTAIFVAGGQLIVLASAVAFAAWLLTASTKWRVRGPDFAPARWPGCRGGFGLAAEEPAFQLTDFAAEEFVLLGPNRARRGVIEVSDKGTAALYLNDENGKERAELTVAADGRASLGF